MRVLVLGGAGRFGSFAARRLAASDIVSEVGIAGRNQDALARVAAEIGDKARAVQLDIRDEDRLASVAEDYDIVVNVAGPEWDVLLPALRGAIAAGTHYCDIGAHGQTTERQLELDSAAKDRDVVAVLGIGFDPGLDNLLAIHASRRLDALEEVQLRHHWFSPEYLSEALEELRRTGHVDTSVHEVLSMMSAPVPVYRDGRWTAVDPLENLVEVVLPEHGTVRAYPGSASEGITLPRYLPGVRSVSAVLVVTPPQLHELIFREVRRISRDGLAPADAGRSFLETIRADPDRWLKMPEGVPPAYGRTMSVAATGWKDGRRARYTCWPDGLPSSTSIPLTIATLRILRGEVSARGVLPPEACFEPMPFFEEAAQYAKDEDRDRPLLGESLEWFS